VPSGFVHQALLFHRQRADLTPGFRLRPIWPSKRRYMQLSLYVEPRDVSEAQKLIAHFGREAGIEASDRAEASRNLGNHLQYCRWRQIERLVIMLSLESSIGTIH
jgi:hypothetical protein